MDCIEDDDLTNLTWLRESTNKELSTTVDLKCSNNHIDDDLQCLCWILKLRPTSSYSLHSIKRLSSKTNKRNHHHTKNHSLSSDNVVTNILVGAENDDNKSTSHRILMVHDLNHHLPSTIPYEQSFIIIRSSNGRISYLSIRHST